jgi:hypothetical protein
MKRFIYALGISMLFVVVSCYYPALPGENDDNTKPIARAGSDQTVMVGESVSLDGSASSDPDEDQLVYKWSMLSKPDGSSAELTDALTATTSFTADIEGTYTIQLIVNDGKEDSDADTTVITAQGCAGPPQHGKILFIGDDFPLGENFDVNGQALLTNIMNYLESQSKPPKLLLDDNLKGHQKVSGLKNFLDDAEYEYEESSPDSWDEEKLSAFGVVLLDSSRGDEEHLRQFLENDGFLIAQPGAIDYVGSFVGVYEQSGHEQPDPLWDLTLTEFIEHPLLDNVASLHCYGPADLFIPLDESITILCEQSNLVWIALWEAEPMGAP